VWDAQLSSQSSCLAVLVLRALIQGRDVKAGLKIPFATFFLEATDHDKFSPKLLPRDPSRPLKEPDA
jgi:hypothetical protein